MSTKFNTYSRPEDMFEAIADWATTSNAEFNSEFVESLEEQYYRKGYLTDKQKQALVNICDGFNIGD